MANRNVTFSLPAETLQAVKIIAVKRDTSLSWLLSEILRDLVKQETAHRQAEQEFMALAHTGFDMGSNGQLEGSRDDLHER